jgi:hypothetical protein
VEKRSDRLVFVAIVFQYEGSNGKEMRDVRNRCSLADRSRMNKQGVVDASSNRELNREAGGSRCDVVW